MPVTPYTQCRFAGDLTDDVGLHTNTFTRTSVAYAGDGTDMAEYAADAARYVTRARATDANGTESILVDHRHIAVEALSDCSGTELLYALADEGATWLSSADGDTWAEIGTVGDATLPEAFRWIFVMENGNLLAASRAAVPAELYLSTDGATWAGVHTLLSNVSLTHPFTIHQANGTCMVCEYGTNQARYIYASEDNGATWAVSLDIEDVAIGLTVGDFSHFHTVGYHAGTAQWVACTGDGTAKHWFFTASQAAGAAAPTASDWSIWKAPNDLPLQPVKFFDDGHATRLIFGSDIDSRLGWIDLSDGTWGSYITDWETYGSSDHYVWDIHKRAGVYYIGRYDNTPGVTATRRATITVSTDLEHWANVYHFNQDQRGVIKWVGFFNDRMWCGARSGGGAGAWVDQSFSMDAVTVTNSTALVLEPGLTNLFAADDETSSEGGLSGWALVAGSLTRVAGGYHGSWDLASVSATGATCWGGDPVVAVGVNVRGRAFLQGHAARGLLSLWTKDGGTFDVEQVAARSYSTPGSDDWMESRTRPITIPAGEGGGTRLRLQCWDGASNIKIDAMQLEELPGGSWQIGGTPRTDELLVNTTPWVEERLPDVYCNFLHIQPESSSEDWTTFLVGRLSIKTWRIDREIHAMLFYDCSTGAFGLYLVNSGGSFTETLSTGPVYWQRPAWIKLAVRFTARTAALTVNNGARTWHVAGENMNLGIRYQQLRYGDIDGANLMPMVIADDWIYDQALTDTEVEELLSAPRTEYEA